MEKLFKKLVIVSNRGPYNIKITRRGLRLLPSAGGLVAALAPLLRQEGGVWVAWGGRCDRDERKTGLTLTLPPGSPNYTMQEVILTPEEMEQYYDGFANACLWPLCHGFIEKAQFRPEQWQAYQQVNKKYAAVVRQAAPPTPAIWVHDYHLALLPGYLRQYWPAAPVALFWHIPFPPAEVFAVLPWARELLAGMLACQLIGFHLPRYARNFLQAAAELAGAKVDYAAGTAVWAGRVVKTMAAPVGIDWQDFQRLAQQPEVMRKASQIRQQAGGRYLLLGVDRLDYTKGITQRLQALEWLLSRYPEYRTDLTFIQVAVPSRTDVAAYQDLRRTVEETVSRINGQFTVDYRPPVRYCCQPLSKADLAAHYLAADMALVTPLKDGLNLVAKEYVATQVGGAGVLLLSPFAGVASQLREALMANPYNVPEMGDTIRAGLALPVTEKKRRLAAMCQVVREQDIVWWWQRIRQEWLALAAPRRASSVPATAPTGTEEDIA